MTMFQAVILGAGEPYRGTSAASLHRLDGTDRILDWLMAAFASVNADLTFVGGYRFEAVTSQYPHLRYVFNPRWRDTGSAASLFMAKPSPDQPCFACYGDIVFRNELLQKMLGAPRDHLVITVDGQTREAPRHSPREKVAHEGEHVRFIYDSSTEALLFTGLILLPPRALAIMEAMPSEQKEYLQNRHLGELCAALYESGIPVTLVESSGLWASMDDEDTLTRFVFGTKAETMERLQGCLPSGVVPPQVRFTAEEWRSNSKAVINGIFARLKRRPLAVRSSALGEDGFAESMAGQYASVLHVAPEENAVIKAVTDVLASYGAWRGGHQVLVQNMLEDIVLSGVAFSRSLEGRAPYYVVNYAEGKDTASVTGGKAEQRCLVVAHGHDVLPPDAPPALTALLPLLQQLEKLTGYCGLDVEFAISATGALSILQVRPIAVELNCTPEHETLMREELASLRQTLAKQMPPAPYILGGRTIWGVMPDWNPAEMIGLKPSRLASSLYRYLITDEVWAAQRAQFGYRDVRPLPLMRLFAGQPYIDVRASMNSFIPASVEDAVAERVVEAGLMRLEEEPHLHDKLEFFLIPTCMDFCFDAWREHLIGRGGLSETQFAGLRDAYVALTAAAPAHCREAEAQLQILETRQKSFTAADLAHADKIMLLLEDCRRYGTLPFAHLARCGFIAASLLRTLEKQRILQPSRVEELRCSVMTISHEFQQDLRDAREGLLCLEELVDKYGHLRPGTYDITSPCYKEKPEQYFTPLLQRETGFIPAGAFVCTQNEKAALCKAASSIGWPADPDFLLDFIRRAIAGREYAKFLFTRNLSLAMDLIMEQGEQAGLSRAETAHLDIADIGHLRIHPGKEALSALAGAARHNMERAEFRRWVALPPLLLREDDVFAFVYPRAQANFITQHTVTAHAKEVSSAQGRGIDGNIILIPQADPGYDWLFGHNPAGLVTMFGGANSHMAIRAAEHGLPAAIGVGEVCYERLRRASLVLLDCKGRRILPVEEHNAGE